MTDEQFGVVSVLLTEIRDALYVLAGAAVQEETDACQHPEESRVSFATPQRPDHWLCTVCRYEHGVVQN